MLARREQPICPACGQRMLVRHGVRLSPMLADIFDLIERAGKHGIEAEVLIGVLWPGKPSRLAHKCLHTNVNYLNGLLVETDIEVRSGSGHHGPYRIRPRKSEA